LTILTAVQQNIVKRRCWWQCHWQCKGTVSRKWHATAMP